MKVTNWGRFPVAEADMIFPLSESDAIDVLSQKQANPKSSQMTIARGLGRSYGDSSLSEHILSTERLDRFIDFDEASGELTCQAGVSLESILNTFVPRGWFLPVTPGTKFVTVAGAVAADVHGKNHHKDGCFSEHVTQIKLWTPDQGVVIATRDQHAQLFQATCGGMGLTGLILEVSLRLKSIQSAMIEERTLRARDLSEILDLFEETKGSTYSVAWIDCISSGDKLGRSLLMLGEHADNFWQTEKEVLSTGKSGRLAIPFSMPSKLLNEYSIRLFNEMYYHRVQGNYVDATVHYDTFFYPLDGIHHWNRMYGSNGFIQYQFVIPFEAGLEGLTEILKHITDSRKGSFLAVLKVFGKANDNYLSFPRGGYTLALDFKREPQLQPFIDVLDSIVQSYDGRLYLAKDSCMSEAFFKASYPRWQDFQQLRITSGAIDVFNSHQSRRLGL